MNDRDDMDERLRKAGNCIDQTMALIEKLRGERSKDEQILNRSRASLEQSWFKLERIPGRSH